MTVLLPSSVAGANLPLLLAALVASATAVLLHPRWRQLPGVRAVSRHSARRRAALLGTLVLLASLLLVLGASLELYHARGCANSALFQREIASLARWLYEFCARQGVPYWVMFGNLLFVLRAQAGIPVGDTDSDIGVHKHDFLDVFQSVANFSTQAQLDAIRHLQDPVFPVYHADRELVQLYSDQTRVGAHADIWLYVPDGFDAATGDPKFLVNADRTVRATHLPFADVMPLRQQAAPFLSTLVSLPRRPEALARAEYGESFMEPLVTRLECMENLWNGYTFYKTPRDGVLFALLVATLTAATASAAAWGLAPLRRAVFVKKRRESRMPEERGSGDGESDADRQRLLAREMV